MRSEDVIAIREQLGLSRKKLAELLGTPYETVCRWENGKRSPSKSYEAQLRTLAGEIAVRKPEISWIFKASNVQRVRNRVFECKRPVLGTVHALFDKNQSTFVASIRLRPNAMALNDLKAYIQNGKPASIHENGGIVGFFSARNRGTCPDGQNLLPFMRTYQLAYCVIYTRAEDCFYVWRLNPFLHVDTKQDRAYLVPYIVVG